MELPIFTTGVNVMSKLTLISFFLLGLVLYANDEAEQPVVTLKPGETATVTKRTVVTIKTTTETGSPIGNNGTTTTTTTTSSDNRPSWRCKNIPDEAFTQLGIYSKGASARHSWENRAGEFVATYGVNCPSYSALEKELPPHLNQKRYTDMLSIFFDLNRLSRPDSLMRIAREDELTSFQGRKGKQQPTELQRLGLRINAAKILLDLKYPEEVKGRYEAHSFIQKFGTSFLDRNGNIRTENIASLKSMLKNLTPQQKVGLKTYLKDTLGKREYPKSGLVEPKQDRAPTSLTKKEAANRTVIQLLLFELE